LFLVFFLYLRRSFLMPVPLLTLASPTFHLHFESYESKIDFDISLSYIPPFQSRRTQGLEKIFLLPPCSPPCPFLSRRIMYEPWFSTLCFPGGPINLGICSVVLLMVSSRPRSRQSTLNSLGISARYLCLHYPPQIPNWMATIEQLSSFIRFLSICRFLFLLRKDPR